MVGSDPPRKCPPKDRNPAVPYRECGLARRCQSRRVPRGPGARHGSKYGHLRSTVRRALTAGLRALPEREQRGDFVESHAGCSFNDRRPVVRGAEGLASKARQAFAAVFALRLFRSTRKAPAMSSTSTTGQPKISAAIPRNITAPRRAPVTSGFSGRVQSICAGTAELE